VDISLVGLKNFWTKFIESKKLYTGVTNPADKHVHRSWRQNVTFEEKLAKLTEIVDKLEAGNELPLEDSLKLFEEGVHLVSSCREMLEKAEQRVEDVLKTDNS